MSDPDHVAEEEIELKLVVADRAALDDVLARLGPELEPLLQENHYFDDDGGRWKSAGLAVRVRRENDSACLTLKSKGTSDGDFLRRGEWEDDLDPARVDELVDGGDALARAVRGLLARSKVDAPEELGSDPLRCVGTMRNIRRRASLPGFGDLVVEADETTYPNGDVRYEVELEVPSAASARGAVESLRVIFERAGVAWEPSRVSKRERLERVLRGESA